MLQTPNLSLTLTFSIDFVLLATMWSNIVFLHFKHLQSGSLPFLTNKKYYCTVSFSLSPRKKAENKKIIDGIKGDTLGFIYLPVHIS